MNDCGFYMYEDDYKRTLLLNTESIGTKKQ